MINPLTFRQDGTFKIVQLTDLHYSGKENDQNDRRTLSLVDRVIQEEQPDLIVYTGDLIWSEGVENPGQSFRKVLDSGAKWNIPFAVIYGNHDSEENITRDDLQHILMEYSQCLAEKGPENINGVGNYIIKIQSSQATANQAILYFFDSGAYAPNVIGKYEWIHQDQVNWYATEAQRLAKENKRNLPALAFFHIPIPEYKDALVYGNVFGTKGESVCSPAVNSGLFTAFIENGDVMATFAGHDHENDYCGELADISLCYGRVTGYNTYGKLQRGARVIRLFEGERRFESWIRLDQGQITFPYKYMSEFK